MPTRRLEDLYITGKEVTIGDGEIDPRTGQGYPPITVWIQIMNPAEHNIAMKKANAARARIAVLNKKPDSDPETLDNIRSLVYDMDREELINLVISEELSKAILSREAMISADPQWTDDNYLEGLNEAWESGLKLVWDNDKEDPEAKRVKSEIDRFAGLLVEAFEQERDRVARYYDHMSDEELWDAALKKKVEAESDMAWLREYRACEVWLSVKDMTNHHIRYFDSREDVEKLSSQVRLRIMSEYRALSIEPIEGKELLAVENSSGSSTPPEDSVTEASSGQEVLPA